MSGQPEIKNAIITNARISCGDRGHLDCWLTLDYGGIGQGFGGYALYLPKRYTHHKKQSVAGHHLFRIMAVAGVEDWADVVGKAIRVRASWTGVEAIGHIINDDWYEPGKDFKEAEAELVKSNPKPKKSRGA